jgi:branched-chain amino acid transport system ATP-binding protein
MSPPPLLEVIDLTVDFGGIHAVDAVSFSVPDGVIVGLIGPNGAGKTTCIDALSGFVPVQNGRILLDGQDIGDWPVHRRANNGLVRTFQSVELFDDLTIRENLLVAATEERWWSPVVHAILGGRSSQVDVEWVLDAVGLGDCGDEYPNELGHGRRRLAGLARALASRPRLVLLDEPAAGLDTFESEVLAERLRSLPALGVSVLLIDHDMSLVHSTCETIHVLDFGQLISSGTPDEVRSDPLVIEAYLGQEEEL